MRVDKGRRGLCLPPQGRNQHGRVGRPPPVPRVRRLPPTLPGTVRRGRGHLRLAVVARKRARFKLGALLTGISAVEAPRVFRQEKITPAKVGPLTCPCQKTNPRTAKISYIPGHAYMLYSPLRIFWREPTSSLRWGGSFTATPTRRKPTSSYRRTKHVEKGKHDSLNN